MSAVASSVLEEFATPMQWHVVNIILLVNLIVSCKATRDITNEELNLRSLTSMNLQVNDTLYIPWQIWAADSQKPAVFVRHTNTSSTVSTAQQRNEKKMHTRERELSSRNFYTDVIRLIVFFGIIFFLFAVVRRLK